MVTRFVDALRDRSDEMPGYPMTYDAGKALAAAAGAKGSPEFAPMWAGQAAPLSRAMGAAELVETLMIETEAVIGRLGSLNMG